MFMHRGCTCSVFDDQNKFLEENRSMSECFILCVYVIFLLSLNATSLNEK